MFYCFLFWAECDLSCKTVFRRTVSGAVNNLLVFIPPNRLRCTFSAEPVWEIVWCRVWRKIRNRNDDKDAGIRLRASAKEVPITQHRCHLFATQGDGQCFHNRCLPDVVCAEKNSVLWQRDDGLLSSAKVVNLYLCKGTRIKLVVQAQSQPDNIASIPLLTATFVRPVHPVARG